MSFFLAVERNIQTIFPWKWNQFSGGEWMFSDTPMEILVMHPTNTEDARIGPANLKCEGSLKHLTSFATEV